MVLCLCCLHIYYLWGIFIYCSQRKFAKVMFSQVSVHGGGVYPSMHWAGGVCPAGYLPRGPEADSPPQPDTMGYGQQADVTHPTGMHSCYTSFHQAILQGTKNGWSDKTHCTWIISMIPSVVVRIFQYVDTDGNYMRTWKSFAIPEWSVLGDLSNWPHWGSDQERSWQTLLVQKYTNSIFVPTCRGQ